MATKEQIKAFIDTLGPLAVKVCRERGYGNVQVWTCICQAALETGWGQSALMVKANAYFGIKASANWNGMIFSSETGEVYDNKHVIVNANFRAYDNPEDSVNDYFDLLEWDNYSECLRAGTVRDAITIIKKGGYATDPDYVESICSVFEGDKAWITAYTVDKQQETTKTKPTYTGVITYQASSKHGWWNEVKSTTTAGTEAYAGDMRNAICLVRAKAQYGKITLQAHIKGRGWLPKVSKYDDTENGYAGIPGKPIDAIKAWSEYGHLNIRVMTKRGWLPWIDSRNCDGNSSESYAGIFGEEIYAIQMK